MDATWPLTGTVDAGMWVCVVEREEGGNPENQASGFAAAPVHNPQAQTFHTKKLADNNPISLP